MDPFSVRGGRQVEQHAVLSVHDEFGQRALVGRYHRRRVGERFDGGEAEGVPEGRE